MKIISAVSNEIYLGKQGENDAVRVIFSLPQLFNIGDMSEFGFALINKRPGEDVGYPITIGIEDDSAIWNVSNIDNAVSGNGECQLNCFRGNTVLKSITFKTKIDKSVDDTGEVPDPYEDILDRMVELYTDTIDAKNDAVDAKYDAIEAKNTANDYVHLASEYSENAHLYSLNAKEYAEDAEQSKQGAIDAEGSARNYSEIAHGYALTAETKANDAGTYAGQALQYKNDAVQAKNDAVQAKNDAVSAKEGAETAQGLAEDARDDAEDILEIITSMLPVDSESGNICNITDGANNLPFKNIICGIEPRQSGSGDPSPTNVRSINGWLGTTLARTGVNLLDTTRVELGTFNQTTGEPIAGSGNQQRTTYYIKVNPGDKLVQTNSKSENNHAFFYLGETYVSTASFANGIALTVPANVDRVKISSSASGWTGTPTSYTWAQVEIGNTATAYKAYSGTNYDVYWGDTAGTVYGGTLNIITGVLTVDMQYFVMDGTTRQVTYTTVASGYRLFVGLAPSPSIIGAGTTAKPFLSDKFKMKYSSVPGQAYMSGGNGQQITMYFLDQTIESLEDANAWLAENQPKFVVALATPITYQLTPVQINTLLGVNNLWCDTGETSAEYTADIGLYIDKKIANQTNNRNLLTAPSPVVEPENEIEHRSDNILNVTET